MKPRNSIIPDIQFDLSHKIILKLFKIIYINDRTNTIYVYKFIYIYYLFLYIIYSIYSINKT